MTSIRSNVSGQKAELRTPLWRQRCPANLRSALCTIQYEASSKSVCAVLHNPPKTRQVVLRQAELESQQIPSTDGSKHDHCHGQAHVEEYIEPAGFVMHAATVGAPNAVVSFFLASWALCL